MSYFRMEYFFHLKPLHSPHFPSILSPSFFPFIMSTQFVFYISTQFSIVFFRFCHSFHRFHMLLNCSFRNSSSIPQPSFRCSLLVNKNKTCRNSKRFLTNYTVKLWPYSQNISLGVKLVLNPSQLKGSEGVYCNDRVIFNRTIQIFLSPVCTFISHTHATNKLTVISLKWCEQLRNYHAMAVWHIHPVRNDQSALPSFTTVFPT
jgi:hypothetical protein